MADRNYGFTVPLVRALASLGVAHACITPGSRSTPLALALAEEPGITDWPHIDERSSAFFALGIGRATHFPAVAVCTSGTAAAEFLPAAVEARHGRVPLILVTADRPADLQGVGAPQTIDQAGLFGAAAKWAHDLEPPAPGEAAPGLAAALAARLVTTALEPPAGPVHLNLRFREPLVPDSPPPIGGAEPPVVLPGRVLPGSAAVARLAAHVSGRRGLVVCGPQDDPALPAAAAACAAACGFPLVADPLSGARAGRHDLSRVIAAADPLAAAGWLRHTPPEVVVRVGALPTSKPLWQWLAEHPEAEQVLIDPAGWRDPGATASLVVRADPTATLEALAATAPHPAPGGWIDSWRQADAAARTALDRVLAEAAFPNEPEVVRVLGEALPAGALLAVASSMPIRDVDAFFPARPAPVRLIGNRGAAGIDGFLSTGLGAAAAAGSPAYLLAGDLSTLHDLTALGTAARLGIKATIVVIHNDGGAIFHFLPQATFPAHFERHWGTPHGLDFVAAAQVFGVTATRVHRRHELEEAVAAVPDRPRLLEVRTERAANFDLHRRLRRAVEEAITGL
ncbi:MAG: 2-succinyl-5-enolpyruvyl-6-hydroxy-3-cyclohexene-1-carboxylic-acid synthase [Acidimicrobiia bacterium]|nr:2-succinyl-5-enolpyruvyl-6-hydroxy-3-cyclohexene-1-carboxylic-acid synthase [Acidimicrobiia bacterium]